MRFLSPWRLVLLLAPLALLAAYVLTQRARRKYVVRFTSVDLLASVAPRRPGWQRHLAAAGVLVALMLLVLGVAHPAQAVRVARQRATIILALDTSGSMGSTDVAPTRLAAAEQEARRFVNGLPVGLQVGLLSFDQSARVLVAPTTDRASVLAGIDALQVGGGTATGDAMYLALNAISSIPVGADGKKAPAVIVLMSDGSPTIGRGDLSPEQTVSDAEVAAKQAGVPIDTIAFGTATGTVMVQGRFYPVPADPAAMAQIAAQTGGRTFAASSASQLKSVYDQVGRLVGYDTKTHDITVWFTGAALLLVALAGVGALVWAERLL